MKLSKRNKEIIDLAIERAQNLAKNDNELVPTIFKILHLKRRHLLSNAERTAVKEYLLKTYHIK